MEHVKGSGRACTQISTEDEMELRRGPWTVEEDFTLINYIAHHGEGRWNSLARCAGLKRTGKSCRLRWLNYLRPDVRRGNITLEEQLLILELHSRWGNRWSKIAQHLPGRTDNEIKNYWRTRVQKHAKQLKCDVNSKQFKDTMRYLWMPRLVERIQAAAAANGAPSSATTTATATATAAIPTSYNHHLNNQSNAMEMELGSSSSGHQMVNLPPAVQNNNNNYCQQVHSSFTTAEEDSSNTSESFGAQVSPVSDLTTDCYNNYPPQVHHQPHGGGSQEYYQASQLAAYGESQLSTSPTTCYFNQGFLAPDFQAMEQNNQWLDGGDVSDNLWNVEDLWFLQQQLNTNL